MFLAMARLKNIRCLTLVAVMAPALSACSFSMPEWSDFHGPSMDFSAFQLRDWNTYAKSQSVRPTTADDLVDAGGHCAGAPPAPPPPVLPPTAGDPAADPSLTSAQPVAAPARGVGLDMTECEVVGAIGIQPQTIDVGTNERGERNVIMTFAGTDRAGTYRFVAGRLVSLERGPEPPPPPVEPQKKIAKKHTKPKQTQKPQPTT
jgi:hypothetical protein